MLTYTKIRLAKPTACLKSDLAYQVSRWQFIYLIYFFIVCFDSLRPINNLSVM